MIRLALASLLAAALAGCGAGGDASAGAETRPAEAKARLDPAMPVAQQQDLSAKLKAWDPKADKK